MTQIKATMLGAFELTAHDGTAIRIETRKARALLAVLITAHGRPVRRDRLAGLLWSRGETRQALASLSQAVYSLRRALQDVAPDAIRTETDTVAVDPKAFSVDVWDLEVAAQDSEAEQRRCLELYSGSFLDDLAIDTEEDYSEWRAAERARWEGLATRAGTALMASWEHVPESADMALVDRLLSIDPYNEPAVRVRMILLAREGRHAAAIEAGDFFTEVLSSELGIAPSEELAAAAARIRAGGYAKSAGAPAPPRYSVGGGRTAAPLIAAAIAMAAVAVLWVLFARETRSPSDITRLLVRPFEAEAGIAQDIAQGFSDDLSTELVRRSGIDILSRESGRMIDAEDEASSGASHVLHGRMRADAGQWVLNVWIMEIGSGREVWAERVSGSANSPRVVRDEIVARISDGIGVALVPLPDSDLIALPEEAVSNYLRALSQLHSGTAEGNAKAIERLESLAAAYPEAVEPVAALVLAYERVAFEADDFARAAGLHWLEGYLMLKRELASMAAMDSNLLAARARLALRRMDHTAAQSLARQALEADDSNVAALEVLARSLALSGKTEPARRIAARAIALSPAAPEDGYTALALAALHDGDLAAAKAAVEDAFDTARNRPLELLALRAAILGLETDEKSARAGFEDLLAAIESRPFGAWRIGEIEYVNPRAATWRRPSAAEVSNLIRFSDANANERLLEGLVSASGQTLHDGASLTRSALSGGEIEDLLFNHRAIGLKTWLVQEDWSQTRTADGMLFQDGDFGPLPKAREGQSHVVDDRLCDRWIWQTIELENCQRVLADGTSGGHVLVGETGWFPFELSDPASSVDQ